MDDEEELRRSFEITFQRLQIAGIKWLFFSIGLGTEE